MALQTFARFGSGGTTAQLLLVGGGNAQSARRHSLERRPLQQLSSRNAFESLSGLGSENGKKRRFAMVVRRRRTTNDERRTRLEISCRQMKPKGMTHKEWDQLQKQQDRNYKLFSQRAKRRLAEQGPRINATLGEEALGISNEARL